MGVQSSMSSNVLLRLVIGILTIIPLECQFEPTKVIYGSCKPADCDDVMKADPSRNDTKPFCRPEPLLKVEPSWGQLLGYDFQSLKLISEFERTGNACFAPSKQPPIMTFPLNLAFLRNCTSFPKGDYPHLDSICPSDCTDDSYVALVFGKQEYLNVNWSGCASRVIVPVEFATDDSDKTEDKDFGEKVKQGFRLQWNLTSLERCLICMERGGNCGLKKGKSFLCFCHDKEEDSPYKCKRGEQGDLARKVAIAASVVGVAIVILLVYSLREKPLIRTKMALMMGKKEHSAAAQQIEGLISSRRYTYKDIKKMTNSFKEKLGQGGYGCVYKGKLPNGQLVAVKILKKLKGNGEEFINEVASISRTSHVNVVSLRGFCFDGSKRALIYEFMPNGSLEKFIFKSNTSEANQQLSWETLYNISLGIAQGVEYLHRGCNDRILHFDIKPHNILLDKNYCPKICDFGLAKICSREDSIVSMLGARGTAGYIAPELVIRSIGGVSHKSDVYSYGMMVLEMVGGRKNIEVGVDCTSEIYFPHWIHRRLKLQEELGLHGITSQEDEGIAKKMIIISLWCIQIDPRDRPSITQVVEMLKGSVEALPIPPKPALSSPPLRSPVATTDEISLL